jgi:phosphatidylserine/phosphatidylglycerophosphate/cardiolipin synthase-like enzyme
MPANIRIAAYSNCDDVFIHWRIDEAIPDCWGFALEREMNDAAGTSGGWVENRVGFKSNPARQGETRPSNVWPFQRFSWTDHKVNTGDKVRYRAHAVVTDHDGGLEIDRQHTSAWTPWLQLRGDVAQGLECYFNRGLVMSQFMARYLRRLGQEIGAENEAAVLRHFRETIGRHDEPIRAFLTGELGAAMVDLLGDAATGAGEVFGALYELEDDELLAGLKALGGRAHIVLANGSVEAAGEDQNRVAREALREAGVDVHDRMTNTGNGRLGHNKFLVFTDAQGRPKAVWTGSTNWTRTGLCTQVNNGLLLRDADAARVYLEQWRRLRDAGNAFPGDLLAENTQPKRPPTNGYDLTVWFTCCRQRADWAALDALIAEAQEGILFLMFQPGTSGQLKTMLNRRRQDPNLYVHGVVSKAQGADLEFEALGSTGVHSGRLQIIEPTGTPGGIARWALREVTRNQFQSNIGHAIVHSKVMVIDPLTNPIVVTGSHNFSISASEKNDENFVILRGHKKLALAYSAHIMSVYHHYRWRAYLQKMAAAGRDPWSGLQENDQWQAGHLRGGSRKEMEFWVR